MNLLLHPLRDFMRSLWSPNNHLANPIIQNLCLGRWKQPLFACLPIFMSYNWSEYLFEINTNRREKGSGEVKKIAPALKVLGYCPSWMRTVKVLWSILGFVCYRSWGLWPLVLKEVIISINVPHYLCPGDALLVDKTGVYLVTLKESGRGYKSTTDSIG